MQVSILSTQLSTETEDLLKIVRNQLNREDIRILTDTIEVVNCKMVGVDIHSKITAPSEDTIEIAKKQFTERFEATKKLGWNVMRSWIIANLFVEGVRNIDLIEPKEDVVIAGNECACLGKLKIELV